MQEVEFAERQFAGASFSAHDAPSSAAMCATTAGVLIKGVNVLVAGAAGALMIGATSSISTVSALVLMTPAALLFVILSMLVGDRTSSTENRRLMPTVVIVSAWTVSFFAAVGLQNLYPPFSFPPSSDVNAFAASVIALALCNLIAMHWKRQRLAEGTLVAGNAVSVVLGGEAEAERLRGVLRKTGYRTLGHALVAAHSSDAAMRISGILSDMARSSVLANSSAVFVGAPLALASELSGAIRAFPVPVYLYDTRLDQRRVSQPVRVYDTGVSLGQLAAKRFFDIVVASVALVILSPLLVCAAAAVAIETGRPILFRQHRQGLRGEIFPILKFRSMTVMENGAVVTQAVKNDKRVTAVGRVLRRTSIDELPQLINVLRGDMSIVGPRPHALAHDRQYDAEISDYALRRFMRPGITGWAQVNGHRGETRELAEMEARVAHDIWYISNWSLWLDVKIVFRTALMVFGDRNAY